MNVLRRRRIITVSVIGLLVVVYQVITVARSPSDTPVIVAGASEGQSARVVLDLIVIKGRAPSTGYKRSLFGDGWQKSDGCDTRNKILQRDLQSIQLSDDGCIVRSGTLLDPYSGATLQFVRGPDTSDDVQIDHVVALSDAWQKGAQALSDETRTAFANDPLNLLAVDGPLNIAKGNSDAASWLPPNKSYRCAYAARQIAVKYRYGLWATRAEHDALRRVLVRCPEQRIPISFTADNVQKRMIIRV